MPGTAVALLDVRKSYGRVEALRGVSVTVQRGEVMAMLGPNGAGKTTAISVMLGMRRPTAGQARLFDLDPSDRAARSRCGVMLQESGVNDVLGVRETVDIFRGYYPSPLPTGRVLELAGLGEVANRKINALSGGQRQRLYYALAICGDPEALFLDEPTAGMDVESRRAFIDGIRRYASEGRTVILSTHYLEEADQLADRVVVIDRGMIIADDSPAAIKSKVASRRVTFTMSPPP
ncbi:MAG: ABC transporter ATP-binding protein, partial [Candidatus Dormibacteria bacterium]